MESIETNERKIDFATEALELNRRMADQGLEEAEREKLLKRQEELWGSDNVTGRDLIEWARAMSYSMGHRELLADLMREASRFAIECKEKKRLRSDELDIRDVSSINLYLADIEKDIKSGKYEQLINQSVAGSPLHSKLANEDSFEKNLRELENMSPEQILRELGKVGGNQE